MKKYRILKANKDFKFIIMSDNTKGTRRKRFVIDDQNELAYFKYQQPDYIVSESCSEKMCYEVAKVLGYECAKIELAEDENGELGILNYVFTNKSLEHTDAVSYLKKERSERKDFNKITNIKIELDKIDKSLFMDFIKIMVFDALVGETDRHEENWGITLEKGKYRISPLYDNGCSLLNKFKNEEYANKYYDSPEKLDSFILKSETYIYDENGKKYKHFDLIRYLNVNFYEKVQKELNNLYKLNDNIIKEIVDKIPDDLLTSKHKEFIIQYLKKRRDILMDIK